MTKSKKEFKTLSPSNGDTASHGLLKENAPLTGKFGKGLSNNMLSIISYARTPKNRVRQVIISKNGNVYVDPRISLTDADSQFLNIAFLIWNATTGHENSPYLRVPVDTYMQVKGIPYTESKRKNAGQQVKRLMNDLKHIQVKAILSHRNPHTHKLYKKSFDVAIPIVYGDIDATDGSEYITRMTPEFFEVLKNNNFTYVFPLPLKLLQLNTSKDKYTWRAGYFLSLQARMNYSDKIVTVMETLLENMQILTVSHSRHVYTGIIKPVIRALNKLSKGMNLFDYEIVDTNNHEVTTFKQLPLTEFKKYRIHIHWHKDYPTSWLSFDQQAKKALASGDERQ